MGTDKKECVSVLISEEKLRSRIKEMAAQISEDFAWQTVHLVCILKGSIFYMRKHFCISFHCPSTRIV